jgi:hypothetical protein
MASRLARSLVIATLAATLLASAGALPALAKGGPPGKGGSITTGNDISWPQCGGAYPSGQAFGIVGLTGGLANTLNSCFGSELAWAWTSTGTSAPGKQPPASLYVNTADPGQAGVTDWPTNNVDPNNRISPNPIGTCDGSDSPACAWQYGWNRAIADMLGLAGTTQVSGVFGSTTPSTYTWWLDVETGNTWETGAGGLANNVADLQGMVAAFTSAAETSPNGIPLGGAAVGVYSTSSQWGQITGTPSGAAAGNLAGLANWIPGARTASAAASNCSLASFTGGRVTVTQWFGKPYDGDYACG